MSKFQQWFSKKVSKGMEIHSSIFHLKRFKWKNRGVQFLLFAFLIIAAVFFYLFGLTTSMKLDEHDGTIPWYIWPDHVATIQWIYFAIGLVMFLFDITFGVLVCALYYPIMFKKSQELYMQTEEYKLKLNQYENESLDKYSLYDLKWLKKAKYISKFTYNVEFTRRKQLLLEKARKKHEKK